jgi:hypothetical protein
VDTNKQEVVEARDVGNEDTGRVPPIDPLAEYSPGQ